MQAAIPNIKRMFAMLLPITLPTAKSVFPWIAENRFTINSGADVPNATMVSPMTIGLTPSFFAMDDDPLTSASPPRIRIPRPSKRKRIGTIIRCLKFRMGVVWTKMSFFSRNQKIEDKISLEKIFFIEITALVVPLTSPSPSDHHTFV